MSLQHTCNCLIAQLRVPQTGTPLMVSLSWVYCSEKISKRQLHSNSAPRPQFSDNCYVFECCAVLSHSDSLRPHGRQPSRLPFLSRQEYWSGWPCPPPANLPHPGIKPRSSALQVDSLLFELSGKPKNTGAGSLSLLQGIFLTQE